MYPASTSRWKNSLRKRKTWRSTSIPKPVVADAGPLLSFARAGHLDLLSQVLPKLWIPPTVYEEIVVQGAGRSGADEVEAAGWVEVRELQDETILDRVPATLDDGEREAIALALELEGLLLIDERIGRRDAAQLGLPLLSSLIVLKRAKRVGLILTITPILEKFVDSGFRLGKQLRQDFLASVGE